MVGEEVRERVLSVINRMIEESREAQMEIAQIKTNIQELKTELLTIKSQ